jgi:hypothetical protein
MLRSRGKAGRRSLRATVGLLVCAAGLAIGRGSPARAEDLYQAAQDLTAKYASQLAGLADWCDQQGLAEQARKTRSWLRPHDPSKTYVFVLPEEMGPPALPADSPAGVVEWNDRFLRLRRDQADAFYEMARRAVRTHHASLAFDLVMAALRENPDHETIRRLLGYQAYRGQWHTRYEVDKLRNGFVWHEKFGWLPRAYVRRYEAGERYSDGRWISADEDAQLHRPINSGWNIETEHYLIRTNHSIEAGVELGRRLERLYRVWKQLFLGYYASEDQVAALFAGGGRRAPPIRATERHLVVYFRDRDDYNQSLRPTFPDIEVSTGVYVEGTRGNGRGTAYFFAGKDCDPRTQYHEATHQLFHESRPVARDVAKSANFWAVEGVAMYLESLREEDGYHVLGGFDDLRVNAARYRLLHDGFYVPLAEFTGYGLEKVRADPRIATLYSQAAGLTYFLIHHDGGRYRDALVDCLTAIYSGQDDAGTLSRLTQTPYSELDKQYRQFMEQGPRQTSGGTAP